MRGDVAILSFEIQQGLRSGSFLQVQRFYLANHDQVIARGVLGVNLAIKPVQAAGNDRITQRRFPPLHFAPLVRAPLGELVGNPDLLVRQDIDDESTRLANAG